MSATIVLTVATLMALGGCSAASPSEDSTELTPTVSSTPSGGTSEPTPTVDAPTPSDGTTDPTELAPFITVYQGGHHSGSSSDIYFIGIETHNFPGKVTCQVTDSYIGGGFLSKVTLGENQRKDSGSYMQMAPDAWVVIRCWGDGIDITSGELHF
jgi:hypothetical protein